MSIIGGEHVDRVAIIQITRQGSPSFLTVESKGPTKEHSQDLDIARMYS